MIITNNREKLLITKFSQARLPISAVKNEKKTIENLFSQIYLPSRQWLQSVGATRSRQRRREKRWGGSSSPAELRKPEKIAEHWSETKNWIITLNDRRSYIWTFYLSKFLKGTSRAKRNKNRELNYGLSQNLSRYQYFIFYLDNEGRFEVIYINS